MGDFKLPANLKRHFVNLSVTIQQLIGEIVLTIEGMPIQENRAEDAKLEQSARARRANEAINDRLREFIDCNAVSTDDAAIAIATANGRNTAEIAEFLGLEQRYVRNRVASVRKLVSIWAPDNSSVEACSDGSVLELFAEAQNKPTAGRTGRRVFNTNASRG